jgi:hypothetical protein
MGHAAVAFTDPRGSKQEASHEFLDSEEVAISLARVCDSSPCGAVRRSNLVNNGTQ